MKVEQAMKGSPISVTSDTTIKEAAKKMASHKVGSLLVVEGNRLVGIMTERDVIQKVVMPSKNPGKIKVVDVMSKSPITITKSDTLEDAAEKLSKNKIKKLPVVEDGDLVGIITDTDIVAHQPSMLRALSREITARERTIAKRRMKPILFSSLLLSFLLIVSVLAFVKMLSPLIENSLITQDTMNMIFFYIVLLVVVSSVTVVMLYLNLRKKH
jgi:CBS domain-containing protein